MTEFETLLLPPQKCDFPYTISEVNDTVGSALESIAGLLWIEGEIADFKEAGSGHCYLRLKDNESQIPAVIWKSIAQQHDLALFEQGMDVSVIALLRVYRRGGYYQLDIKKMQPKGASASQIIFEKLKNKLTEEGVFSEKNKKKLPSTVKELGIITAKSGAALWDIVRVVNKRSPGTNILLASTSVQGIHAPEEIANAIKKMNKYGKADVLIVGRGGGSSDDLDVFNDELVVRAIYESSIPVISAVGHEIDVTLSDLAADLRAPTPSGAAEIAVRDNDEISRFYRELTRRFSLNFKNVLINSRERFQRASLPQIYQKPLIMLNDYKQTLDYRGNLLVSNFTEKFKNYKNNLTLYSSNLNALSPLAVLSRGYAVARSGDGKNLTNTENINIGDTVDIKLSKGEFRAEVTEKINT